MKRADPVYPADAVWAAAFAAHRVNGQYIKVGYARGPGEICNRDLIRGYLEHGQDVTDQDRELAQQARSFFKGFSFKALKGDLGYWDKISWEVADKDQINSHGLSVIAALPSSYFRLKHRESLDDVVRNARGGLIGTVGKKIDPICVKVLACVHSIKWFTHFVTAVTDQDQVVKFALKDFVKPGTMLVVQGRVRGHTDNVTQLHYTRVKP